jgi:hypothetical protein
MLSPPCYAAAVHREPPSRPTSPPRPGSWSPGSPAAAPRTGAVRLHREMSRRLRGQVLTPADVPRLAQMAARMVAADCSVDREDATEALWTICQETWNDVDALEGADIRPVLDSMVGVCAEMLEPPVGRCCPIC